MKKFYSTLTFAIDKKTYKLLFTCTLCIAVCFTLTVKARANMNSMPLQAHLQYDLDETHSELPTLAVKQNSVFSKVSSAIMQDYQHFYQPNRLLRFGTVFALGATAANTNIDSQFRDYYQKHYVGNSSNDLAETFKHFGEVDDMVMLSLALSSIKLVLPNNNLGEWGSRSSRAFIIALPLLGATQHISGASRPNEAEHNSKWKPFEDTNGVSGHTMTGAIPFLTIAKMYDDKPFIKYSAYLASTLAGWSRINDDKHYLSQTVLGWYLAWEAVDAVFTNTNQQNSFMITPVVGADYYGLNLRFQW